MANRRQADALRHAQGCGYLVMGAEPGSRPGITPADPSVFGLGVQPYLGSEGPAWTHQHVQEGGTSVLVVTLEPPRPGHRIFTLQKEFAVVTPKGESKTYMAGTVFVRHPGRTDIARPGDIRALEERFAAPAKEAEVHARRMLEVEEARLAAEELDRRRRWLTDVSRLVTSALFKATPYRDSPSYFRCAEQIELQTMLARMTSRIWKRGFRPLRPWLELARGRRRSHLPRVRTSRSRQPCAA
jgi:hypothetical protein